MGVTVSDDEQEWVQGSLQGDPEAFACLVRRYQRMIHALTFRMTGSFSESEDLAQETFVLAYRRLETFRQEARFSTWLTRIAINLCLSWRTRQQRREAGDAAWDQLRDTGPGVEESTAQAVQEALMQLPPKQRAAVVLTVYEGLNHAEAARALGCSETTVSWRLFMARGKLKRILGRLRGNGNNL